MHHVACLVLTAVHYFSLQETYDTIPGQNKITFLLQAIRDATAAEEVCTLNPDMSVSWHMLRSFSPSWRSYKSLFFFILQFIPWFSLSVLCVFKTVVLIHKFNRNHIILGLCLMPCCIVILLAAFKSDFTCHQWEFHLHYLNLWKGATLMAFEECSCALTHSLTWRLVMNHSFGIWAVMFTESTSCLVPYASPRFFTLRLIFLESWNKSRRRGAQPKESDSAFLRASHLVSATITNSLNLFLLSH